MRHPDKPVDALARRQEEVVEVPLDRLVPSPDQPRSEVDPSADQELLESIRAYGVLTPIQIRPVEEGKYEVVAGERRWRACALLGKTSIPALVRRKDRDRAAAEALIDNEIGAANQSPTDEGEAR